MVLACQSHEVRFSMKITEAQFQITNKWQQQCIQHIICNEDKWKVRKDHIEKNAILIY